MEKDWLTVIIVILMIGIALDGLRRMRKSRRENLRLSRNAQKADKDADPSVGSSEFPSGGARVAGYREENEAQSLNKTVKESFAAKRVTKGAPQRIPQQVALNLEESVPMLMDSVEMEEKAHAAEHYDDHEPESYDAYAAEGYDDDERDEYRDEYDDDDGYQQSMSKAAYAHDDDDENSYAGEDADSDGNDEEEGEDDSVKDHREPQLGNFNDLDDEPDNTHSLGHREPAARAESRAVEHQAAKEKSSLRKASYQADEDDEDDKLYKEPDEVLIMNIMAKPGYRFNGEDLLQALMDEGLKLGAMDIFHRHLNNDGDAPVLFSLANMVVPGTFNLSEMQSFQTPGVSMFLSLPVEGESLAAYNDLARTARSLAEKLDGELKDENRSVMTNQTIEHGRQRVIEYERKKKLARA
ncbi:Cell division protein ZipA [Thalassocella blandensis]|nr:Cell division protein ZipA [Thalassocella blandensis]